MKTSIIIPVKEINDYIRESIPHILNMDYQDFEILIFPDILPEIMPEWVEKYPEMIKIISSGKVGPAAKRDLAIKYASGEILAFLDDDAYPRQDWLDKALKHFQDSNIVAVGGPAVTPEDDSFRQKVSGAVFLSKLSGGYPERYWSVGKIREVDDWPSVNLLVRKEDFAAAGGFDSTYWPGEDTKLCFDLIKKTGKKIIYDPEVLVYHHRRPGLIRHLRQVGNYGLHRGFFAKKYPATSFKLKYFIPSLLFLFIVLGWVCLFPPFPLRLFYVGGWILYGLGLLCSFFDIFFKTKDFAVSLTAIPYIFLTHLWYGWRFIKGFIFTEELKR